MILDQHDIAILNRLSNDARISWAKLGESVNLSASAVQRRVQKMCDNGVIHHFQMVVDAAAMGQTVRAFVQVKIARSDASAAKAFRRAILAYREVEACYQITGNMDFILIVHARDIAAFGLFLENRILYLPGVTDATSSIVLNSLKEHGQRN